MIVGQQKPFEEIWEMVKGFKKILVFGCNTCVAICHAGGAKEAELLASMIRMKAAQEGLESTSCCSVTVAVGPSRPPVGRRPLGDHTGKSRA